MKTLLMTAIELEESSVPEGEACGDTPLPFAGSAYRSAKDQNPEQIRQMKHLYEYGPETMEARAANFYRQAVFMRDYEDDVPWTGELNRYYATYHDLTTRQLRGYFSWRTGVRKGCFAPVPASVAYIYVYELINGVGASSPEDALQKLLLFEEGYLDTGIGDPGMRKNLRRWMLEYAIVHDLPREQARLAADPELVREDAALSALLRSGEHTDEEVFAALLYFGGKKLASSPVLADGAGAGMHLFCEAWRAASHYSRDGKDLFTLCFGKPAARPWHPFANAVYHRRERVPDLDYQLNECRVYRCRAGIWQVESYEKLLFDRDLVKGFLQQADAGLRRYLKTGRYLRENPANAWAVPYIMAVAEADRRAAIEAARPKITIDLSGLDQIRQDAAVTRDSLLTEEERNELYGYGEVPDIIQDEVQAETPDLPLDAVQAGILRMLLRHEDPAGILRANHLMPSLTADLINEGLYDMFAYRSLL